jgi:hypothetical protein
MRGIARFAFITIFRTRPLELPIPRRISSSKLNSSLTSFGGFGRFAHTSVKIKKKEYRKKYDDSPAITL